MASRAACVETIALELVLSHRYVRSIDHHLAAFPPPPLPPISISAVSHYGIYRLGLHTLGGRHRHSWWDAALHRSIYIPL